MTFPNPDNFGMLENPLTISPYFENDDEGTIAPPPMSFFLMLAGPPMQFLDGQFWLLL